MKSLWNIRPPTSLVGVAVVAALLVACTTPLAPPTRAPGPIIKVGTKNFAEQLILGEMYALLLENAGFRVERRFDLGPTEVAHAALVGGEIDLYPEYTGTGLLTVLREPPPAPPDNDPDSVFNAVARGYRDRFDLVWLAPAPADNTQAVAMTRSEAARLRIVTLSDFVARANELAAQGATLILAGPPEFATREDGLPGIRRAYGDFQVDFRSVAAAERYQLLTSGEVNAVVAFGTDGELGGFNLATLIDDKAFFPPYNVAPVVRQDVLNANPGIRNALDPLAPRLNEGLMREMNFAVTHENEVPADVARRFLIGEGLIPGAIELAAPNVVGSYRIAALDGVQRLAGQFTVSLHPDNTAAITWVSFVTDTLQTSTGTGAWTQLGNTVTLTVTEANSQPLQPPAVARLTFDDHFITSVDVANDPTGTTGYSFFIASGDRDPAVRELHQRMARIPWLNFADPGPSNAVYDELTRQTIVAFQSSQNLLPTGVVDAETWAALGNPQQPGGTVTPPAAPTFEPSATPSGAIRNTTRGHGRARGLAPVAQATLVPTRVPPEPAQVPTRVPPGPSATATAQPAQPCAPTVIIGDAATNLRGAPSTNAEVLAVIPASTSLPGAGVNGDRTWYQVDYFGTQGWVFGELVSAACDEDLPVLDVPTPALPPPSALTAPSESPPAGSGDKVLYLSFDDGPHSTWTPQILEVLQGNSAKATFFQIGQQVAPLGDIVKQQLAAGMDLGNHTWAHGSLAGVSQAEFDSVVNRTHDAQAALGAYKGPPPHCLRPPYGATDGNTRPWAEALGYRVVLWTIDPQDWALPGTQQIINHILTHAQPGAILLSHDGGGNRSQTVDAYRVALPQLAAQGYRFESLGCP